MQKLAQINEAVIKCSTFDVVFKRDEFACNVSWIKFLSGERMLEMDFVNADAKWKYFLADLDLVDYGLVIVTGPKRSGKSLWDMWLADSCKRLFGKATTVNFRPREAFGEYNYLTIQSFVDEWVKLTELADREDSNSITTDIASLTKSSMFYNRVIILDEARKWVSKYSSGSRAMRYIGELADIVGHNHNIMVFSMPNADRMLNRDTILENRTHEVKCSFETFKPGYCSYGIKVVQGRYEGKVRWMHLPVKQYAHLWNSWNLIGMSQPITKKQDREAQQKLEQMRKIKQGGLN